MPNINITVREKIAHTISDTCIVCGNSDYVAVFDFDAEWDAYETKTARFIWDGKYTDVLFEGTECPVPVIMDAFGVLIGVYAGELHTTTAAAIDTNRSILSSGGLPANPPSDVYTQIVAKLAEAKTLSGDREPTTETEGAVGQMYYDKTGKRLYVCTNTASGYAWQAIEAEATVDVDDTLTKAGKAADAKTVGNKIAEVNAEVAGKLGEKELAGAIDTALAQAKESGAFDGAKGDDGKPGVDGKDGQAGIDGKDGVTPHIGGNGNWYIGDTDTGVKAQGDKGEPGTDGQPGVAGQDGVSPHIGENGHWWIGTTDTGVSATGGSGGVATWELINEIMLTETANNVVINKDANGNAFSLQKAKVECVIQLDESDPFTYIKLLANGYQFSANATTSIKSGTVYYSVLIDCMGPAGIMGAVSGVHNMNYNWQYTVHKMGYRYNKDWQQTSITSITVSPNDGGKPLGTAGTKIVIFGVRA